VGPGHEALAFVDQCLQRFGDHLAGLGGFDDGVEEAAVGGDVRVEEALGVVRLERGTLLWRRPTLQAPTG